MSTGKERTNKVTKGDLIPFDENIISSIVINGDISKLSPNQKVEYYRQFCDRVGLDPMSQPFKLLRLNGKEILYCDRSGAQQLNKLHNLSHQIVNREIVSGCYVVTARASNPDGRHTENIGAVPVDNLRGDALCNAMMKAETKAKRRTTLDLLGLGILDESETETIVHAQKIPAPVSVPAEDKLGPFKRKYDNVEEVTKVLEGATDVKDIANLYYINAEMIESLPDLKQKFTDKKNEFFSNTPPPAA